MGSYCLQTQVPKQGQTRLTNLIKCCERQSLSEFVGTFTNLLLLQNKGKKLSTFFFKYIPHSSHRGWKSSGKEADKITHKVINLEPGPQNNAIMLQAKKKKGGKETNRAGRILKVSL